MSRTNKKWISQVLLMIFILFISLVTSSQTGQETEGGGGEGDKKGGDKEGSALAEANKKFDNDFLKVKQETLGKPYWQMMMRYSYKTCSNWAEIQIGQTDFVSSRRECATKCYQMDDCSGVLFMISQTRGCRFFSGTCYAKESYRFEYYHKPVPFTTEPYLKGVDDRSVRFEFAQFARSDARCWIYSCLDKSACEKKAPEAGKVEANSLPPAPQAVQGQITGAYMMSQKMSVTRGEFFFTPLEPETQYQVHCANAAGFRTEKQKFKTSRMYLDYEQNFQQGCPHVELESRGPSLGFFPRVALQFCREMCIRFKCFSFMYGRPDRKQGGTCMLSHSCGKLALQGGLPDDDPKVDSSMNMANWDTYTSINLDYDVIMPMSKCTASANRDVPPVKSIGSGFEYPVQCKKACYEQPGCEHFLFGNKGASKGACLMVNADCSSFEADPTFDVWKLIRLEFHWWKHEAECLGGSLYFGEHLDFEDCRMKCKQTPNCNYFVRGDVDQYDRGLCIGANNCDKTRPQDGFIIYQIVVPPPLQIEQMSSEDKTTTRFGTEEDKAVKKVGEKGGGKSDAAAGEDGRRLELGDGSSTGDEAPTAPTRRELLQDQKYQRMLELRRQVGLDSIPPRALKVKFASSERVQEPNILISIYGSAFTVFSQLIVQNAFYIFPIVFGLWAGIIAYSVMN